MGIDANSTVQVTIQVVDANSGAAVQQVSQKLQGLAGAGKAATTSMGDLGKETRRFEDALKSGTAGASQAFEPLKGNIRQVGAEFRELGLRGSYTFKHMIADSEALMGVMHLGCRACLWG